MQGCSQLGFVFYSQSPLKRNDLDGTVVEEKISHAAGVDTGQELSKAELVRVIRAAGRVPVERDTLYNVVRRYDGDLTDA